ncbi:hypothetical protein MHU86_3338 [Fragilaria crotonensis]|nr:hypothetical protein MHU86_3338 [Fragilaria crotonensis]
MLLRRATATVARRYLTPWAIPSAHRCPAVLGVHQQRWLRSGPMVEAEIVSPLAADLHKALRNHELLVGVRDDKIENNSAVNATPEEIRESLETIRHLQFQLEGWKTV